MWRSKIHNFLYDCLLLQFCCPQVLDYYRTYQSKLSMFSRLLVMKIINFQTFNLFLEILTHRYFCKLNLFLFIIAIIILKKMFDSDLSEANGRERQSCKCSYCPYIEHHLKKIPEILAPVNQNVNPRILMKIITFL